MEDMRMKILASDYDGTLRTEELVDINDVHAIHEFRAAGNMFGLVTGRSMESIQTEIQKNKIEFDFIVANNGGVIYDRDFQRLQVLYMDFNKALDIIAYIKTLDCVSYVINDGFHRFKFSVDENQIDHKYGNMPDTNEHEEEVLDRGKISQLVVSLNDTMLAEEISHYINTNFKGYAVAYVNVNCVDIVPEGVSKAEGLYFIEQHLGLEHDAIYAIGDSFNDIPMIEEIADRVITLEKQAEHVFISIEECIAFLMKL